MNYNYHSLIELVDEAIKKNVKISELVIKDQAAHMEITESEVFDRMAATYDVMLECIRPGCSPDLKSTSGLTGGAAYKMMTASDNGTAITGSVISGAIYRALAVSELNASMGRIVASPTAGSCGILPAAVITMQEEKKIDTDTCVRSLFTASAVGMVIATNASVSGAEGGCQAECGSAAAMAAAAITELAGGTPMQIYHAVAIALKNILGLVCDPVAGLVEIPCIKRNASGVTNAFTSAEMALAGIESAIPADEVIICMKKIGNAMSPALRETAEGGLADTPTGRKLREHVFGNE